MKVHDSARKRGVEPDDAVYAAEHALFVSDLDEDDPVRQLRLVFDTGGRLLELVVLRFDNGHVCRPRQRTRLTRWIDVTAWRECDC